MLLSFTEEQVDALLPTFLFVDRNHNISAMGSSISRRLPEVRIGMPCTEAFQIHNLEIERFFEDGYSTKPIRLVSRHNDFSLYGAAIFHDDGCLLAVRFVLSEELFANGPLDLSDFGHTDPVVLSTMLIALQRAMLEEAQNISLELARERQRSTDLLIRTRRTAGYLGHDFNNLLSIIQLNADRMLRLYGQDKKIAKLANIINETATRASQTTKVAMTLVKQHTGTLQPLSVDAVIRNNISILKSVVGSTVTISLNLQADKYKSVFEYNELLGGIINVIINAREVMPNGGRIEISTSVESGQISGRKVFQPSGNDKYIAIRIADNGVGMSEALLSRAFEPRFSSKPGGTGLGLASVRDFAIERGGDAWLESVLGKGTTVHILLPVVQQSEPTCSIEVQCPEENLLNEPGAQRILLVEDEPYALEALAEMLEAEGHAVTSCMSSEAALKALEREPFHILLTDIVMPGSSGIDIASKASADRPTIKVILMSGFEPSQTSLQPGWLFLHKPLDRAELLQFISA